MVVWKGFVAGVVMGVGMVVGVGRRGNARDKTVLRGPACPHLA